MKRKNLFYFTYCEEVKPFYCYEEENLDEEGKRLSPKHYSVHKAWKKSGEKVEFYYATNNSPEWDQNA